jgi:hypothetical protein
MAISKSGNWTAHSATQSFVGLHTQPKPNGWATRLLPLTVQVLLAAGVVVETAEKIVALAG